MVFLSQLLGQRVKDRLDQVIGRVSDIVIHVQNNDADFPVVHGIMVGRYFIPAHTVQAWSEAEVRLTKLMEECRKILPRGDDFAYLKQAVLDKQIVDLAGVRVVRVNDLQLSKVRNVMSLVAIDISTSGLLRRLGMRDSLVRKLFKSNLVEWHNVHILGNKLQLDIGASELVKLHPADIANIIEKLNVTRGSLLLQSLDKATAARVLEEIQPDIQKVLVKSLGFERAASVMAKMSTDELVDLIKLLPELESQEIIRRIPVDSKRQKVKTILEYDEETAGALMNTEYLSVRSTATVQEVIDKIKKVSQQYNTIHFVYVTDSANAFVGLVSLRNLIVSESKQEVSEIMKSSGTVSTVTLDESLTDVATLMTKYNLLAVAVLDEAEKLVGVITVDDVMRHFIPNA